MKPSEAIEILDSIRESYLAEWEHSTDHGDGRAAYWKDRLDALDTAIQALQSE